MTLADIAFPVTYEWGKQHALVFSPALAARLAELHAQYGRPDCLATPLLTADGRYLLSADILNATEPGGYLYAMWQHANMSVLLPAVQVVPMSDGVALLPQ